MGNPISSRFIDPRHPRRRDVYLPVGLFEKESAIKRQRVNLLDLIDAELVDAGLINANLCCEDFVANFQSGDTLFTTNVGVIQNHTASAINSTATATAAQVVTGWITSTSAAATVITLPIATDLVTALGAAAGSSFEFIVDNSAGASTVTVAVNTGITVGTQVITGGNTLTVSTANVIGVFRLVFTSATAAILRRIA